MTIEEIELRTILTQMLADNGINKETIKDLAKEVISEKADRGVKHAISETNIEGIVNSEIKQIVRRETQDAVSRKVRDRINAMKVEVTVNGLEEDVDMRDKVRNELIKELKDKVSASVFENPSNDAASIASWTQAHTKFMDILSSFDV